MKFLQFGAAALLCFQAAAQQNTTRFALDEQGLKRELKSAKQAQIRVSIPGETVRLNVVESPIMARELAARYPEITTYKLHGENMNGRLSITPKGVHGILFTAAGTVYIDPADNGELVSYFRSDYVATHRGEKQHECLLSDEYAVRKNTEATERGASRSGEELRTYRLALACTGEYTQFHGGTVADALSAMVVTMNRVNGLYERDLAITMELIGNNDDLIFTNPGTDPYSNNNGGAMLSQNQSTVHSLIGAANYDIGHVFSTGGGGIASLGSVCSNSDKAQGVTGSSSPTGDAFDIDYVAHEIGHQFGGEHTFNATSGSCSGNREASAAYEPGSGTTIMAYAGICGNNDNVQSNSDDHFHAYSLEQIIDFSQFGNGDNCPTVTAITNTPPTVDAGASGYVIPKETPFQLNGSAEDDENSGLLYCWEQMDLGPGGAMSSPSGNAPIFRSWEPKSVNYRVCPRMVNVIIGNTATGELYPTYTRDMSFRLTVRDQNGSGGGVAWDEMDMEVDGNSGPFVVTTPVLGEQVQAEAEYTVTWDVAGTDAAPINCDEVSIELCSYNATTEIMTVIAVLATATANDGQHAVTLPASAVGGGRYIRVNGLDNIFFNINPGAFTVTAPAELDDVAIVLSATPNFLSNTIDLVWTDSFNNEAGFVIERSNTSGSGFVTIDSVTSNTTTYADGNVVLPGETYYYRVKAYNSVSTSAYSNEAGYDGVGITTTVVGGISVYPNPAVDQISVKSVASIAAYSILDVRGVSVLSGNAVSNEFTLDVANLPTGTYQLVLTTGDGSNRGWPISIARR